MQKKNFPGALNYFLPEGEYRIEAEFSKNLDPLVYERIKFREELLNQIICRIGDAHCKINLVWSVLNEFDEKKSGLLSAEVTLEAQLAEDIIENNLLKIAEAIKELYKRLNDSISPQFGHLFRRIGKDKLKNIFDNEQFLQSYTSMRSFLFPDEKKDQVNVTSATLASLSKKIEDIGKKIIAFRDKVIAHKDDQNRFKTHLSYQEYLIIYESVVEYLNAISIVATLKPNDWAFLELFDQKSNTKKWLRDGLIASLSDLANVDKSKKD